MTEPVGQRFAWSDDRAAEILAAFGVSCDPIHGDELRTLARAIAEVCLE